MPDSTPLAVSDFLEAIHPNDRGRIDRLVQSALTSEDEYESEYRITHPNGETRWIYGYGRAEFDPEGKAIVMRGVVRDITQRKLAEEALRESEARFRTVADVAPVMIWMTGRDNLGNFFNKGWLEFTGRTAAEESGHGWTDGVHPEDIDSCLQVYETRSTRESRLRSNTACGTKMGNIAGCSIPKARASIQRVRSLVISVHALISRIESKRSSITSFKPWNSPASGRLAVMGELAASLAHEVNNPLGAMVTNANAGQRCWPGATGNRELQECSPISSRTDTARAK